MMNMWLNLAWAKLKKGNILIDSLLVIYIVSITIILLMNYHQMKYAYYQIEEDTIRSLFSRDYEKITEIP